MGFARTSGDTWTNQKNLINLVEYWPACYGSAAAGVEEAAGAVWPAGDLEQAAPSGTPD